MTADEFDELTRRFSSLPSRRARLRLLGRALLRLLGRALVPGRFRRVLAIPKVGMEVVYAGGAGSAPEVTAATIAEARAALAAGASDVALDAAGTLRYVRELSDGDTVRDELREGDRAVIAWKHTEVEASGEYDADGDGFSERRVTVRSAAASEEAMETLEFPAGSDAPSRRETLTRQGDTIQVVIEEADETGTLQVLGRDEADFEQTATSGMPTPSAGEETGCTAEQLDLVQRAKDAAAAELYECLKDKRPIMAQTIALEVARRQFSYRCVSMPPKHGLPVGASITNELDWRKGNRITVNKDYWFDLPDGGKIGTLGHELLHIVFGPHERAVEASPRREDADRTYACTAICFQTDATECQCAKCFDTHVCDPRCKDQYKKCRDPVLGYRCTCPGRERWYATDAECRARCPSGLSCFGFSHCKGDDRSCRE